MFPLTESRCQPIERVVDMQKVSISQLENLYREFNTNSRVSLSVGSGKNRFEIKVKHRLSMDDVNSLVSDVCDGVLNASLRTYKPELQDYYLRKAVLKAYANLDLPQSEDCWELVYGTPIFAMIVGHDRRPVIFNGRYYDDNLVIDIEQYEQIISAINQKIAYALNHKICDK